MKWKIKFISLLALTVQIHIVAHSQTFKSVEKAKLFFEKLDDEYNKAMVEKDSMVFVRHLADTYINCTPQGTINKKKDEIRTLLALPLLKVERTAPQFEIFMYSGDLSTFSVVKKLTNKSSVVAYVRRTTVYQLINGRWQSVSGQGTIVPTNYVE